MEPWSELEGPALGLRGRGRIPLTLARIQIQRLLSHPGFLGGMAVLGLLVPVLSRLTPLGVLPAEDRSTELARGWAVPVGFLGIGAGLAVLGSLEGFLRWLPPASRVAGELAALVAAVLAFELPLFLGAALTRGGSPLVGSPWTWVGGAAFVLHAAALGTLLLRFPGSLPLRASVFLVLVWMLPLLLTEGGGASRWVGALLDPTSHLRALERAGEGLAPALVGLTPIVAIGVASRLLAGSPVVRDPRPPRP